LLRGLQVQFTVEFHKLTAHSLFTQCITTDGFLAVKLSYYLRYLQQTISLS